MSVQQVQYSQAQTPVFTSGYTNLGGSVANQASYSYQVQGGAQQIQGLPVQQQILGGSIAGAIPGGSTFQQIPIEKTITEQIPVQSTQFVPVERKVQDYMTLQNQVQYIPQQTTQKVTEYQTQIQTEQVPVQRVEYVPQYKTEYQQVQKQVQIPVEKEVQQIQYVPQQTVQQVVPTQQVYLGQTQVQQNVVGAQLVPTQYVVRNQPGVQTTTYVETSPLIYSGTYGGGPGYHHNQEDEAEWFENYFPRGDYAYRDRLVYGSDQGSVQRGGLSRWDAYDRALHKLRNSYDYQCYDLNNYDLDAGHIYTRGERSERF